MAKEKKKGNGHEKIDEIGNQQEGIRRGNENINRLLLPALQSSTGYRDEIKVNFKEMWFLELWTRFFGSVIRLLLRVSAKKSRRTDAEM